MSHWGRFSLTQNDITKCPMLYVGWKRDYDHPTTFFYAKNSWKFQKGILGQALVFLKNYITWHP